MRIWNGKKKVYALLSVLLMILLVPLNLYALSNEKDGTDVGLSIRPVDDIEPGEVFTSGIYVIEDDFRVIQNEPGKNGIEIQGKVMFLFKGGHSLEIIGGDAKGSIGAGAGVDLPKTSALILKGEGTFKAKGGNPAIGTDGSDGGHADVELQSWPWPDYFITGKGGAGGGGGGGGGAGVGTSGGNGGEGGQAVNGGKYAMHLIPASKPSCNSGKRGESAQGTADAGTFVVHDGIKIDIKGGKMDENKASPHGGSKGLDYHHIDTWGFEFLGSGGAGGGAGGNGFDGADIGSGGSGGAGGGSGGTGFYIGSTSDDFDELLYGGGGGAGCGKGESYGGKTQINKKTKCYDPAEEGGVGSNEQNGKGGEGAHYCKSSSIERQDAGNGGDGGTSQSSGDGGTFYSDINLDSTKSNSIQDEQVSGLDGQNATNLKFIQQSNCQVKLRGGIVENTVAYTGHDVCPKFNVSDKRTGKIIPGESYIIDYSNNKDVGRAQAHINGTPDSGKDAPIIVSDDNYEILGVIETFFDIRYATELSGIKVKSKEYDGKIIKPEGKLKIVFNGKDVTSQIRTKNISYNYYKLTESGEEKIGGAPKDVGKYKLYVQVKDEKYVGVLDAIRFDITPRK